MRLQSFIENYVSEDTLIRIVCKQEPNIFFEGYKEEIPNYPEIAGIAGELGLWLHEVFADDALVIVATY